jgi:lipoprotein-anchoring transpeptidase ErfK/SrfK
MRDSVNRLGRGLAAACLSAALARGQEDGPDLQGLVTALRAPGTTGVAAQATTPATPAAAPAATGVPPPAGAASFPGPALRPALRTNAWLQIALDRHAFGCGLIDGVPGRKTAQALLDFRYASAAGSEAETRRRLLQEPVPPFVAYEVTPDDLAQVGQAPADWEAAAELPAMACGSLAEVLSEKFHASQAFLQRANPSVAAWDATLVGRRIWAPNARADTNRPAVAQILLDTHALRLRGYDRRGRLTCSFPCSIARDRAKVPTGELSVANVAPHPNYTFDPANFPESERAQQIARKLILPPGPRNPVGVFWISLSQPGYGVHGTPHPETIGNMESHGCFRLCNWDAATLGRAIELGVPVRLDSTRIDVAP